MEEYSLLNPVISIVLTRFELFPWHLRLHSVYELRDAEAPEVPLTEDLQFHFLELTERKWEHFRSQLAQETGSQQNQLPLRNWMDFLLNANRKTEDEMESMINETPGLDVAYGKFQAFTRDEELRDLALRRQMAIWDRKAEIEKGMTMGIEKGMTMGIEKGVAMGIEKGVAQGLVHSVCQTLQFRFGSEVPMELIQKISAITDTETLQMLFQKAFQVQTLSEFTQNL